MGTNGTTAMVVQAEAMPLAKTRDDGLVMVVSPAEARRRVQELQAFVQEVMIQGVDFGTIPGTDKPSLFQPGAQKLAELYGFAHDFADVTSVEDWDRPFFFYRRKCILTSRRDERYIGSGIGSCNSREDRYAGRWVFDNEVPKGLDLESLPSKTFQKRNGGGSFRKFRVPNPDLYSLVNTIEKMACKRAYVGAVIAVTRSAGLFTQDVEDLPAEAFGRVDDERPWEKEKAKPAPDPEAFENAYAKLAECVTVGQVNAVAKQIAAAHKAGRLTDTQLEGLKVSVASKRASLSKPAPEPPPSEPRAEDDGPAHEREPGEEG